MVNIKFSVTLVAIVTLLISGDSFCNGNSSQIDRNDDAEKLKNDQKVTLSWNYTPIDPANTSYRIYIKSGTNPWRTVTAASSPVDVWVEMEIQ